MIHGDPLVIAVGTCNVLTPFQVWLQAPNGKTIEPVRFGCGLKPGHGGRHSMNLQWANDA